MNIDTREITLEPADNARLLALCGPFDDNIKQLERRLGIEINRRDNHFKLTGRALCVHAAADILRSLYVDTAPMRGQIQDIEPEQIHLAIKEARVLECLAFPYSRSVHSPPQADNNFICISLYDVSIFRKNDLS